MTEPTGLEIAAGPSPAQMALGRAALDFAAADLAVRTHVGPRQGEEFEIKLTSWRQAYDALIEAAAAASNEDQP